MRNTALFIETEMTSAFVDPTNISVSPSTSPSPWRVTSVLPNTDPPGEPIPVTNSRYVNTGKLIPITTSITATPAVVETSTGTRPGSWEAVVHRIWKLLYDSTSQRLEPKYTSMFPRSGIRPEPLLPMSSELGSKPNPIPVMRTLVPPVTGPDEGMMSVTLAVASVEMVYESVRSTDWSWTVMVMLVEPGVPLRGTQESSVMLEAVTTQGVPPISTENGRVE